MQKIDQDWVMNKTIIKNIFYLASIFIFITLTASFYFSDQNIRATNKSRSFYVVKLLHDTLKLPSLTNDTKGIIEYRNDVQEFIDKRKKWIWQELIKKKTSAQFLAKID